MYSYKNLCVVLGLISSATAGTFTNDPGGRANCLEMVTFLAGESGPDARAEIALAGTDSGPDAKHPANRQPPAASLRVTRNAALSTRQTSAATPLTERITRSDVRSPHQRPFSLFSPLAKTWWVVRVLEEIWLWCSSC